MEAEQPGKYEVSQKIWIKVPVYVFSILSMFGVLSVVFCSRKTATTLGFGKLWAKCKDPNCLEYASKQLKTVILDDFGKSLNFEKSHLDV